MHFEILVEDASGKVMLEKLIPQIINNENHSFKIKSYKGIGKIPRNLKPGTEASKRILLDQLLNLLKGYGKTFNQYPTDYRACVFIICDLDKKCLKTFRQELFSVLDQCKPKPETRFCIAIEEGEAWLLGDIPAIKSAYSNARDTVLNRYENDSICDTWEFLADAIYKGGSESLKKGPWNFIGMMKSEWVEKITPHMDIHNNNSPSFCYFRDKIMELIQ